MSYLLILKYPLTDKTWCFLDTEIKHEHLIVDTGEHRKPNGLNDFLHGARKYFKDLLQGTRRVFAEIEPPERNILQQPFARDR